MVTRWLLLSWRICCHFPLRIGHQWSIRTKRGQGESEENRIPSVSCANNSTTQGMAEKTASYSQKMSAYWKSAWKCVWFSVSPRDSESDRSLVRVLAAACASSSTFSVWASGETPWNAFPTILVYLLSGLFRSSTSNLWMISSIVVCCFFCIKMCVKKIPSGTTFAIFPFQDIFCLDALEVLRTNVQITITSFDLSLLSISESWFWTFDSISSCARTELQHTATFHVLVICGGTENQY